MNWRLSRLDNITLISNSDAHSPIKIGREANVFDAPLDYQAIIEAIKSKDKKRLLFTVEFFPQEGKYHFDGHRNCNILFSPEESRAHKHICPACGRALTVGVMNRVEQLSDRQQGYVPESSIPFRNLIPLDEIIAEAKGVGKQAQAVEREYRSIIQRMESEFNVLLDVPEVDLQNSLAAKIAQGIINVRRGSVKITPGYDGVYGKIDIFSEDDEKHEKQMQLF
jgi:uncharacterized protein (TIGR00375 family)